MGSISLNTAQTMLEAWINAEKAVTTGQSYRIGNRSLERANISEIRKSINYWQNQISKIQNGRPGARVMRVIPRDL